MKEIEVAGITKERLRALPPSPGVYLMKDTNGVILYIGKAKSLKSRVSSYFSSGDDRQNVTYLLERVSSIETLVTESERQALILEADLIRKHKPRYNVRLKDDRAHLMVRIDVAQEWPRLELVRQIKEDGARYLGPYAFSYELRTILEVIKRSIPLRTCSDSVLYNRVRPCLEFQIKRCSAPCCFEIDKSQYDHWIEQAISLLEGNTEEVVKEFNKEMEFASEELRFEDAATLRDRIQILERIAEDQTTRHYGDGDIDSFGIYFEGNKFELSVLSVRNGRLFEAKTFGFDDVELPVEELIPSLLSQYYAKDRSLPETIILPLELDDGAVREEMYSERRKKQVKIVLPQRGLKKRLLELAAQNAKENFEARFSELDKADRILKSLQLDFDLEQTPRVIECIDVSHFQGAQTVGSVVCFKDTKPDKSRYRSFHLSQEGKPDDFASMREIVKRHLSRCAEENTLADLIVVDGGAAQLSQALAMRNELGLDTPTIIGMAKKRTATAPYKAFYSSSGLSSERKPERIFLEGRSVPVLYSARSEVLHLLERLRNEAHRFAITFHRKTRSKRTFSSKLDSIPGIGKKRRNELLRVYGSVSGIKKASADEISKSCGMPLSLAEKLLEYLSRK